MKSERLQNAIGMIDADLLERSEKPMKKKRTIKITAVIAAVLACAIGLGIFFGKPSPIDLSVHAISVVQYPEMEKYPDKGSKYGNTDRALWKAWERTQEKQHAYFGSSKGLEGFISATASEILSGDGTENRVYSPMSLYMALAMLAEVSDGNTRAQILNLLGAESIEVLRVQAKGVWNANYNDDGSVTSILASSLWLDKDITYNKETLDRLAEVYYASSFSGEMGSEEMNLALREWLNEQTGGQLKDQIDDIAFDPRTFLGLATTVYFRAKWYDEFSETKTEKDVFHGAKNDVTVDFMNTTTNGIGYFWGENFSATVKGLEESGSMYWILPDENVTTEMLLQDEEVLRFISSVKTYENVKRMKVHLSVPKFDVSFDTDLVENLKNLGLTDCFSYENSDFSHLLEANTGKGVVVDELQHGTRVSIDEDGVTGMSYTVIEEIPMGIKPTYDEIDFVVDRPYIFVITGEDGSVLFVGVVNQL